MAINAIIQLYHCKSIKRFEHYHSYMYSFWSFDFLVFPPFITFSYHGNKSDSNLHNKISLIEDYSWNTSVKLLSKYLQMPIFIFPIIINGNFKLT